MKQTPVNDIHNASVFDMMRKDLKHVVEAGSSSGALARVYRVANPGVRYTGIELESDYADLSRQHCTDVICGNIERLPAEVLAELSAADCWVFADVLEHLYNPWTLLKGIRERSAGSVEVVACIPNMQYWALQSCLNTGAFVYQDSGLLDRTHIRWFTRMTMIHMFTEAGFSVVDLVPRFHQAPSQDIVAAIRQMATASGGNPDLALQDAMAFQYVLKAVAGA